MKWIQPWIIELVQLDPNWNTSCICVVPQWYSQRRTALYIVSERVLLCDNQMSKSFLCPAVIELIQTDVSQYPFHQQPPAYLRAHRYRYWFTEPKADGSVLSLSPSVSVTYTAEIWLFLALREPVHNERCQSARLNITAKLKFNKLLLTWLITFICIVYILN